MRTDLLAQIKKLRLRKELTITAMPLLTGLTRQQYGRIEAGGNPSLNTLDAIVEALGAQLVLVPKEKSSAVRELLERPLSRQNTPEVLLGGKSLTLDVEEETQLYKPFKDI